MPMKSIQIGGVALEAIVDTGSQVTTLTESFFCKNLDAETLKQHHRSFKLTAANGLEIPLSGCVVTDTIDRFSSR